MPVTVVCDTNVLFSAVGWRGNPFRCVELARSGQVLAVTCEFILRELAEKLIALQKPDGSWVNDNKRWWETDSNLVTAYTVLSLELLITHWPDA